MQNDANAPFPLLVPAPSAFTRPDLLLP